MTLSTQAEMNRAYKQKLKIAYQLVAKLKKQLDFATVYPEPDWANVGDISRLISELDKALHAISVEGSKQK